MAFRTQKISQMTPKGSDLEATDLIEVSTIESGSYVTRSITGQEIIDAIPAPSVDWGDIGGTLSDQTDLNTALSGKVPTSRTLTINGTTQDLSADRTFTISTGITIGTTAITSGTVGRVLFEGTGNVVQESANLFWDNTNGRLGIGTSSPNSDLDIVTLQGGNKLSLNHGTTGSYSKVAGVSFGANSTSLSVANNGGTTTFIGGAGIYSNNTASGGNTTDLIFWTTAGGVPSAKMRITNDGNLGVNTSTIGSKLQINGNTAIGFSASTSAPTNGLAVNGGSSLGTYLSMDGTGVASPPTGGSYGLFPYSGVGLGINSLVGIGIFANGSERMRIFSTGNIGINTTTDAGFRLDVNGTARVVGQATIQGMTVGLGAGANANSVAVGLASLASNSTGSANTAVGASALTSNVSGASNTGIGFAALSLLNSGSTNTSIGSASLRNVTTANNSTAIGNEAGRYIANGSTLVTTVTDSVFLGSSTKPLADSQSNQIVIGHNAIGAGSNTVTLGNTSITKTILRGTVNAANLPTSSAGLSAGDIWNDAGTLKIV